MMATGYPFGPEPLLMRSRGVEDIRDELAQRVLVLEDACEELRVLESHVEHALHKIRELRIDIADLETEIEDAEEQVSP